MRVKASCVGRRLVRHGLWVALAGFGCALAGCADLPQLQMPRVHDEFVPVKPLVEDCSVRLARQYRDENYQETLIALGPPARRKVLDNGRIIIDYDAVDSAKLPLCDKRHPHVFPTLHFAYSAEGLPLDRSAGPKTKP